MKKIKNKNIMFLFLLVFSMSLVLSVGCDNSGFLGTGKIHDNFNVIIACPTCNYINFTLSNSTDIILNNVAMTKNGGNFEYVINGTNLSQVGVYYGSGGDDTSPLGFCFDITITGRQSSLGTYVTLIFITILMFLLLVWINFTFNEKVRESLYKKIVLNYFNFSSGNRQGNLGHAIFYALVYGILKNLIMFYYLIIVFFMFMMTELVESFGITSLIVLFTTILNIVIWGFVVVFIIFIFNFYELFRSLISDINKLMLGVANDWK